MDWARSWGASAAERVMPMACDEILPHARLRLYRAVSVHAPVPLVYRWLCQLKLAPYSYDLLDNFGRRSPRNLLSGVEQLEVGQRFMTIFTLERFVPEEHITLRSHRTAVTYAVATEGEGTRLVARVLFEPPGLRPVGAAVGNLLAVGDLVMMRKQLLTFKKLAERDAGHR
jgi:hypothetical protein